jgi:hypothetical protein
VASFMGSSGKGCLSPPVMNILGRVNPLCARSCYTMTVTPHLLQAKKRRLHLGRWGAIIKRYETRGAAWCLSYFPFSFSLDSF